LLTCVFLTYGTVAQGQNLAIVAKGEKAKVVQIIASSERGSFAGSGVWINDEGYVATCFHVVNVGENVKVTIRSAADSYIKFNPERIVTANWQTFEATIVKTDPSNDVAILKAKPNPFASPAPNMMTIDDITLSWHYEKAELESDLPEAGETVLIGGYPLGLPYIVFQEGTVASIAAFPAQVLKILLSVVANHGNSGGPVFNDRGKVIGLLEEEIAKEPERTGIEYVVPAFYVTSLMKTIAQGPPSPLPNAGGATP
jgi:putative serine protease PepD